MSNFPGTNRPIYFEQGGIEYAALDSSGSAISTWEAPGTQYSEDFLRSAGIARCAAFAFKRMTSGSPTDAHSVRFATAIAEDPSCDRYIVTEESMLIRLVKTAEWSQRRGRWGRFIYSERAISPTGELGEESTARELDEVEVIRRALNPLITHYNFFSFQQIVYNPLDKHLELQHKVTDFTAFALDWERPNLRD